MTRYNYGSGASGPGILRNSRKDPNIVKQIVLIQKACIQALINFHFQTKTIFAFKPRCLRHNANTCFVISNQGYYAHNFLKQVQGSCCTILNLIKLSHCTQKSE